MREPEHQERGASGATGASRSVDEDGGTEFARGGVFLKLTYPVRGEDGLASIPFRSGPGAWLGKDDLADDIREFAGVQSRPIGFESLLHGQSTPRDDSALARAKE